MIATRFPLKNRRCLPVFLTIAKPAALLSLGASFMEGRRKFDCIQYRGRYLPWYSCAPQVKVSVI